MNGSPSADESVLAERRGDVVRIILNRPTALNAFAGEMRERLAATMRDADASDARVLVVTGAGRAFCAGADLHALHQLVLARDLVSFERNLRAGAEVVRLLATLSKPVIAALNGPAAGAGASLACACDLRVASASASIGFTFSRVALHPDWGASFHLPRLVGPAAALDLVLSGRMVEMREARRLRLVDRVVPRDQLEAAVEELAASLAVGSTPVVALSRRSLGPAAARASLDAALDREIEAQLECFHGAELHRRLSAFLASRGAPPRTETG
jgi:2-(1,2-epoxy-1,2-dihydrophenyl)acetyl-CoA isomerase